MIPHIDMKTHDYTGLKLVMNIYCLQYYFIDNY